MKVWVVTGEYQSSRNGDVAWIVGAAKTRTLACSIARDDAEDHGDGENVLIDGERFQGLDQPPPAWGRHDWTISYTVAEHEVRSA